MIESCNIVIITGRNVVGKTVASNYLRDWCLSRDISCEHKPNSDALSLLKALQSDDKSGGFHHTHDWCESTEYNAGHSHQPFEPILPFTVIGNTIPDAMLLDFFTELTKIPRESKMYFVEWAAGSNTNPENTSASEIDYSYTKVKRMLQEGSLPNAWLAQVHSVIHLIASDEKRLTFNEERQTAYLEEILDGIASWPTDRKILQFYGNDDFSEIKDIFMDIPVYEVTNDGSNSFFETKLNDLAHELFISFLEMGRVGSSPLSS